MNETMANEPDYPADDLLQEFLTEAVNGLRAIDADRARLKQDPTDRALQRPLLDLLHTAKGACGFLPLPRLEALASAAAALVDGVHDGRLKPTPGVVILIFGVLDRLHDLLDGVSQTGREPAGDDAALVGAINAIVSGALPPSALPRSILFPGKAEEGPEPETEAEPAAPEMQVEPAEETAPQPGRAFLLFRQDNMVRAIDAVHVEWLDLLDRPPVVSDEGKAEIPFQGAGLPLAGIEGVLTRNPGGPWPLIVLTVGGKRIGLVVDEVMDVVADPAQAPGTATEVIDVSELFD